MGDIMYATRSISYLLRPVCHYIPGHSRYDFDLGILSDKGEVSQPPLHQ